MLTKNFNKPMIIRGTGIKREIVCPICNQIIKRSLPPHMRKNHPKEWDEWCIEFLDLYNKGNSPQQIMNIISAEGRPPFTWSVIAKEIKRIAEEMNKQLLPPNKKITRWQPEKFNKERTTIWQFKNRGNWAVHQSNYRGNWPPQIPRNLILHYLERNDLILDPFVGGGTTLIESRLLGKDCIGLDISPHSIGYTKQKMNELTKNSKESSNFNLPDVEWALIRGDARNLGLRDESVGFVCGQPPYADIIKYTYNINGDLSHIHNLNDFYREIKKVASELYRVLKKGKYCVILIGDIRRNKTVVPLGFNVMQCFLDADFHLKEIIIKTQHKEKSTQNFYRNKDTNELRFRIAHEYLFIFRKD